MSRFILVISFFLLVFLILEGVLLWWPKLQDFLNLKEQLEVKEAEIKQKEEYFTELNSLSRKMKDYSEELAKIDSALPEDPSIPALFNFIQVKSSENGLILENLTLGKIGPSLDKPGVNQISFNISVSGSYFAFKNFLFILYKNVRIIDVSSIKFSSFGEEKRNLFVFDMSLVTYSYAGLEKEEKTGL